MQTRKSHQGLVLIFAVAMLMALSLMAITFVRMAAMEQKAVYTGATTCPRMLPISKDKAM